VPVVNVPEAHPMLVQAGHGADVVDLIILRLFPQLCHPQLKAKFLDTKLFQTSFFCFSF
jgi:hypothetical protein